MRLRRDQPAVAERPGQALEPVAAVSAGLSCPRCRAAASAPSPGSPPSCRPRRRPAARTRPTATLLERYLAGLHRELAGKTGSQRDSIGELNDVPAGDPPARLGPVPARHRDALPRGLPQAQPSGCPGRWPRTSWPRSRTPRNLDRWANPAYRLITVILIRCGLRISSAVSLPWDCVVTDADGAPYLRYYNTKMKREALVPIDDELQAMISAQQQTATGNAGRPGPRCCSPGRTPTSTAPGRSAPAPTGRALCRWLERLRHPRRARPARPPDPAPVASHAGNGPDQPRRPAARRAEDPRPRLAGHDRALRPAVGQDRPRALGKSPQGQRRRAARPDQPRRAARRRRLGETAAVPRHPGAPERLLPAARWSRPARTPTPA